jgi:hypothetical protein
MWSLERAASNRANSRRAWAASMGHRQHAPRAPHERLVAAATNHGHTDQYQGVGNTIGQWPLDIASED